MTINVNNLNSLSLLLGNLKSNKGKSAGTGQGAASAVDPLSLFGASSVSNPTNTNDPFLSTPIAISKTAQLLASRGKSLTKLTIGVLEGALMANKAQGGLIQAGHFLDSLKDLLTQGQDASLSSDARQTLSDQVQKVLADYGQLVDTTQHAGRKVLSEDGVMVVPTNEAIHSGGILLKLVDISAQKMKLDHLDVSTPEAARKSLLTLNQALKTVDKAAAKLKASSDQLNQSATLLEKTLGKIRTIQNSLNS